MSCTALLSDRPTTAQAVGKKSPNWAPVYVTVAGACVFLFVTRTIGLWAHWYCQSLYLRLQTNAFLRGTLALQPVPQGLEHDMAWNNGLQQVWGLGVPLIRLPFEALARVFGASSFPDRIVFVLLYVAVLTLVAYTFLPRPIQRSDETDRSGATHYYGPIVSIAVLLFAPPFLTLVCSRFEVYEEVVAYGYLWSIMLFILLKRFADHPRVGLLMLLAGVSGFAPLIRPTLEFYGIATLAIAVYIAKNARLEWRHLAGALFVFLTFQCFLLSTNYVRFGSALEFGHRLNLNGLVFNTFALKFDYPFKDEPFPSASKELCSALFLVKNLNGWEWHKERFFPGQSTTFRWREFYMDTFDLSFAVLLFVGWMLLILVILRGKRAQADERRCLWPFLLPGCWSVATFSMLFGFYLWSPSLSSRYNLDFLPAIMVAIAGLSSALVPYLCRLIPRAQTLLSVIVVLAAFLWIVMERAKARYFEGYHQRLALTVEELADRLPSYRSTGPEIPQSYAVGEDIGKIGIRSNGDGWDLKTGSLGPVIQLFFRDVRGVSVDLTAAPGRSVKEEDYLAIRAKVGLEELQVEGSFEKNGVRTIRFAPPTLQRYRHGIQVVFVGFIDRHVLGKVDPPFRLLTVSCAGNESASIGAQERGRSFQNSWE